MKISENPTVKMVKSEDYNYIFSKKTGAFVRWGKTLEDDPDMAPAPELADIEVTTICHGVKGKLCDCCYKSNNSNGKNMSFETFKKLFHSLPKNLTQIAFGSGSSATENPDLFKMMEYCRNNDYNYVVPNITVSDITEETAKKLAGVCGAVAVSLYDDKNVCYDIVKMLTDNGLSQVNIHICISEENYEQTLEACRDYLTDPRLKKLKSFVFLSLKQKGRGTKLTPLSMEKFKNLVDFCIDNNAPIGFDSCSATKFLSSVKDHERFEQFEMCSEPCESTCFSLYFNVDAEFFPCSFTEGTPGWEKGLAVNGDFEKDIWQHPRTVEFRKNLLGTVSGNSFGCRECPIFKI